MKNMVLLDLMYVNVLRNHGKFDATKARKDISDILIKNEKIKIVPIKRYTKNKIIGTLEIMFQMIFKLMRMPKDTIVIIQYPMIGIKAFYLLSSLLSKFQTSLVIHDLLSYRFMVKDVERKQEITSLNKMKHIIVHTEAMKKRLIQDGVNVDMVPLYAFDYLLPLKQEIKKKKNAIVFAGSLGKSLFLKDLNKIPNEHITFNLYGINLPQGITTDKIYYKGAFLSDDITSIEGDWGLLWDGNSITDCKGNFGEYLTIIASHKFSLYIACKMKVIVWEKSALADLVREKKLGIVVKDLYEIDSKISQLSEEQITEMENNVKSFAIALRQGNMFKTAFDKIV